MVVNNIKTKVMLFGKHIELSLKLNDEPLEIVQKYKCLGNIVNSISTTAGNVFKENAEYLVQKSRKAIFNILNKTRDIGDMLPKYMFYLYQSMVQPILTYGSEIWGVDKKSCKIIDT